MEKTKAIIVLAIVSVLLVAVSGVVYAQAVSAQNNTTVTPNPKPQGTTGTNGYPNPQQGYYYPYGQQYGSPYGCRMGMCNCSW